MPGRALPIDWCVRRMPRKRLATTTRGSPAGRPRPARTAPRVPRPRRLPQLIEPRAARHHELRGRVVAHLDQQLAGGVAEHRRPIGPRAVTLVRVVDVRVVVAIDDPVLDGDRGHARRPAGGEGGAAPPARLGVQAHHGRPHHGQHRRHLLVGPHRPRELEEDGGGEVGFAQVREAHAAVREGLAHGGPPGQLGPDAAGQRRALARLARHVAAEVAIDVDVRLRRHRGDAASRSSRSTVPRRRKAARGPTATTKGRSAPSSPIAGIRRSK